MTPLNHLSYVKNTSIDINIYVKRDDLLHPNICGNKWRKLKYQIEAFRNHNKKDIITWGGALSNHLHAISYLIRDYQIPVTAFIPADQRTQKPPSLQQAVANGLVTRYVSRADYRGRFDQEYMHDLQLTHPDTMLIPEGGSSPELIQGVEEMVQECIEQCPSPIDYWIVPVGTGGTMLGIIRTARQGHIYGISAVKGGRQSDWVDQHLGYKPSPTWDVLQDYHLGGMGRFNTDLISSMSCIYRDFNIRLDPVYTSKAWLAMEDLIGSAAIPSGATVVFIHTGGLIGIDNFNYLNPAIPLYAA